MSGFRLSILLSLLGGSLLISCFAPAPDLVFRDETGAERALKLGSRTGMSPDGGILPAPGQELIFSFKKPLVLKEEGMALYLRGRGPFGEYGIFFTPGGAAGARGSSRFAEPRVFSPLPDTGGVKDFKGPLEFFLSLPPGSYGGFGFRRSGSDGERPGDPEKALRLDELGLRKHRRDLVISPGAILASSDLNLERSEEGGLVFRFPRDGASPWTTAALSLMPPMGGPLELRLSGQGKTYGARISSRPVAETFYFHPPLLGFSPEVLELRGLSPGGGLELRSLPRGDWERGGASFDPIPVDLRFLVEGLPAWRGTDFEVFSWNLYPDILLFDTRDYQVQNRLFHRLAFFAEKKGFRGSLHRDELIGNRHGWNAHNYSARGLAAFFEEARRTAFPLNEMELWLGDYLLSRGTIQKSGPAYVPGRGGILSISRESAPAHRRLLLTHEIFHGIYYQLPEFRRLAARLWNELPPRQKEFWTLFFSWMQYDVSDPELMVNEFQAYLLQQSPRYVDEYFKNTITSRLLARYPEKAPWFEELYRLHPRMFSGPAGILSDHLDSALGIRGGDVFSLTPLGQ